MEIQELETSGTGAFQFVATVGADGEFALILVMRDRGVRYPFERYPEIRELEAMLRQLRPGRFWEGAHFCASADATGPDGQPLFQFCRRTDRVLLTFSETEWRSLNELSNEALSAPRLRTVLDRLSLEYGDV
jgi:hypothetical protein